MPRKVFWKPKKNLTLFLGLENGTWSAKTAGSVISNEDIFLISPSTVIMRINMWYMESFYLPDLDFGIIMTLFDLIWPPWKCNLVIFHVTHIEENIFFRYRVGHLYLLRNWLSPNKHVYGVESLLWCCLGCHNWPSNEVYNKWKNKD